MKKIAAFALIALTGCAGVDHVGPEVPLPAAARQAVAQAVANTMKDPNSAEFRDWHAFQSQKGLLVCGEVNAKNGYGGYVGFTHFVAHAAADGRLLSSPAFASDGSRPDVMIDSIWRQYYPGCYTGNGKG